MSRYTQDLHRARARMQILAAAAVIACAVSGAHAATAPAPVMIYAFTAGDTGSQPDTELVLGPDGYFYGTTSSSAAYNSDIDYQYWGGVYKVKPDGSDYQMLHTFTGNADGGLPAAKVLIGKDGSIYGTTSGGNLGHITQYGTIWKMATDGSAFTVLHVFAPATGANSGAPLVQDSTGTLYGATGAGGTGGHGVVFSLRPDGSTYKVLHNFADDGNGATPVGVTLGTDGNLYGVGAQCNCANANYGSLFSLTTDGKKYKLLHAFDPYGTPGEGRNPVAPMIQVGNAFYGTTNGGGQYGDDAGTVYKVTPKGAFTTVYSMQYDLSGGYPTSPLMLGANGNLYGTAPFGGLDQFSGSFFEINTKGKLLGLDSPAAIATQPQAGFATGPDGRLYTSTIAGGPWSAGTLIAADTQFGAPFAPPTVSMYVQPFPPVITLGQSGTLTWTSDGATSCAASGAWAGNEPVNGSQVVTPTTTGEQDYTLTCTNKGGSAAVTSKLFVNPAQ